MSRKIRNVDPKTLQSFGDEWSRFKQSSLDKDEAYRRYQEYFHIFPWHILPTNPEGFDMGCGTGRWSQFIARKVKCLHCIDPAKAALDVASENLCAFKNVQFHLGAVDDRCLPANSQDFGFSLGVLHHVPNTEDAIRECVAMLKPGAPLLLYLYYAFDNRPFWFRIVWRLSDVLRSIIHRLPPPLKAGCSEMAAAFIYLPLSKASKLLEAIGFNVSSFPLSYYRNCSFYTMRTDARDRFGTPLEHRFTRAQIIYMCKKAGLTNLQFSNKAPFWCVVGVKDQSID